ncbi:FKBP-type peptidyl-prolyl cis-trans isomerase N-terminal domain-containing protein [Methyloglobulus sp.]|uniref:FKBP-type peptidyl-prolyl cis-trans isomerase N-terminal domain-containing protein n=1 Tax=Methyloglobulus sp. TaxID=2518622 RepID=UPI0032B87D10
MPEKFLTSVLLLLLSTGCATNTAPIKPVENKPILQSDMQKSSYAQGIQYMKFLKQSEIPLDQDLFVLGMNDELNKNPARLDPEQLQRGQDWVYVQQFLYNEKIGKENSKTGTAFLDANKQKPGVHTTASGLQYKILVNGKSTNKLKLKDIALVRYRLARISGEELANTQKSPKIPELPIAGLVKGWQEALLMMTASSKWELYIPSNLAYGEVGAPEGKIQQNETLIFDVELVGIKPPSSAKAAVKALTAAPDGDIKPSSRW